ncbi:MAG: ribulose-phosphate 3-epimerase [Candidatus Bathyarchaeota archaeon]|nr:ribulose-phosphate 3-epimerase [Candidatus Bathyarchaeota archaeon]
MRSLIVPAIIAKEQSQIDTMLNKVKGKAERIMIDVMDNQFVPNTSLDFDFKLPTGFEYEAHLMIRNPLDWVRENGDKVDIIIIHIETLEDIVESIELIKKQGNKVSLAMRPETQVDTVLEHIKKIDGVLVMTADPGHYCEVFLLDTLDKIKKIREIDENIPIEVDGCMDPENVKLASNAGANVFATGSYIFKSDDVDKALRELRDATVS